MTNISPAIIGQIESIKRCLQLGRVAYYCYSAVCNSDSLAKQQDLIDAFVGANVGEIVAMYSECGKGSAFAHRSELQRMLDDAKLHAFDTVIIPDAARLSRDHSVTMDIIAQLSELRVRLICVNTQSQP